MGLKQEVYADLDKAKDNIVARVERVIKENGNTAEGLKRSAEFLHIVFHVYRFGMEITGESGRVANYYASHLTSAIEDLKTKYSLPNVRYEVEEADDIPT